MVECPKKIVEVLNSLNRAENPTLRVISKFERGSNDFSFFVEIVEIFVVNYLQLVFKENIWTTS